MTDVTTAKPPRPTPRTGSKSRVSSAAAKGRDAANDVGDRILDGVEANPLAVLAGGIAVGLVAGALLPKTEVEGRYLGPIGAKLNDSARSAALAARDAGTAELTAVGLSKVGASQQVGKMIEGLGKALHSAGDAARSSRKKG